MKSIDNDNTDLSNAKVKKYNFFATFTNTMLVIIVDIRLESRITILRSVRYIVGCTNVRPR